MSQMFHASNGAVINTEKLEEISYAYFNQVDRARVKEAVAEYKAYVAREAASDPAQLERLEDEARVIVEKELDEKNHSDLCGCVGGPENCVTYGERTPWSYDYESVIAVLIKAGYRLDPTVANTEDRV